MRVVFTALLLSTILPTGTFANGLEDAYRAAQRRYAELQERRQLAAQAALGGTLDRQIVDRPLLLLAQAAEHIGAITDSGFKSVRPVEGAFTNILGNDGYRYFLVHDAVVTHIIETERYICEAQSYWTRRERSSTGNLYIAVMLNCLRPNAMNLDEARLATTFIYESDDKSPFIE